jgi:prefoldin subunit 5
MERQQFEQLIKLLKELNENLESIGVGLGEIVSSLDDIRDEIKQLKSGH